MSDKLLAFYVCQLCDHQLRTTSPTYLSPCPVCGGKMEKVSESQVFDKEDDLEAEGEEI